MAEYESVSITENDDLTTKKYTASRQKKTTENI